MGASPLAIRQNHPGLIDGLMNANTDISWLRFNLHEAGVTGAGYFEERNAKIAEQAFTAGASTHHFKTATPGWYYASDGTDAGDRYWKDTGGLLDSYCRVDDILGAGVMMISFIYNQDVRQDTFEYIASFGSSSATNNYFWRVNLPSQATPNLKFELRVDNVKVLELEALSGTDYTLGVDTAFTIILDCTASGQINGLMYADGVLTTGSGVTNVSGSDTTNTLPDADTNPAQRFCLFANNVAGSPSGILGSSGTDPGGVAATNQKIADFTIIKSSEDILIDAVDYASNHNGWHAKLPWSFT